VPLVQIGAEEIANRGVARIEDVVNILPNVFVSQTAEVANGATGTSTLNLRGLGAVRTLVLLDGKRLPFGSPFGSAANVDMVPSQLVERVDVITSGASAVYGSDAVAGVVNFVTKRNFEGFEIDYQYGLNNNPNDNGFMADVLDRSGIDNPGGNTGGDEYFVAATMGMNSSDGRGNVTAYMNYQRQSEILGADRDTGACTLGGTSTISCVGSSNFRRFNTQNGNGALFQETTAR
jgi:iron complex outermembrane receptor protein